MQSEKPARACRLGLLLACSLSLPAVCFCAEPPANADMPRNPSPIARSSSSHKSSLPTWIAGHQPASSEQRLLLAELRPRRKATQAKKTEEDPNDYLQVIQAGSSSSAHRKAAIAEMPLQHLPANKQAEVQQILKSVSFYRRLPTVSIEVDHRAYLFLIGQPDVTVSIWRAMKISKVELWQTGRDGYEADAGDGTTGTVEVLHRGSDRHLVLCKGLYKSPLMAKPIEARSLVMLTSGYSTDAEGRRFVTHRADLFVQFPSQTISTVARIISPLTVSMTDRSFSEVSVFLRLMSLAMARRPDWVEGIARQLDGVPEQRRDQLITVAAHVYADVHKRTAMKEGKR